MNLAPRKLGSFERWILAFSREAGERRYRVELFGREPIHPSLLSTLRELGVIWSDIHPLEQHPLRAPLALARRFDVLHLNLFAARSRVALCAYAAWPTKVLFMDRTSRVDRLTSDGSLSDTSAPPRWPALDRLTMLRVKGYGAVSDYIRRHGAERFDLPNSRSRTIHNGVDVDQFFPPEHPRDTAGPVKVLAVANLIREKGIHHLLDAFAMIEDSGATLDVVGEGRELTGLVKQAESLRITHRVRFLGLRNDVPSLLREADIFVHPAIWEEAFANAPIEAMASGCAVIATNTGGTPELIEHGRSGWLVPAGDVNALAEALRRIISEGSLRRTLADVGHQRVLQQFTLRHSVARHLDWCEWAVSNGGTGDRLARQAREPLV